MQFSTQAATILAVLCMSAPALATMVNGIPIQVPEAVGIEARDPSFWTDAPKAFADLGRGGSVGKGAGLEARDPSFISGAVKAVGKLGKLGKLAQGGNSDGNSLEDVVDAGETLLGNASPSAPSAPSAPTASTAPTDPTAPQ
jgi:hypothetical protein